MEAVTHNLLSRGRLVLVGERLQILWWGLGLRLGVRADHAGNPSFSLTSAPGEITADRAQKLFLQAIVARGGRRTEDILCLAREVYEAGVSDGRAGIGDVVPALRRIVLDRRATYDRSGSALRPAFSSPPSSFPLPLL